VVVIVKMNRVRDENRGKGIQDVEHPTIQIQILYEELIKENVLWDHIPVTG
jgi:hypothetical protein